MPAGRLLIVALLIFAAGCDYARRLAGWNPSKLSDTEFVAALQDAKKAEKANRLDDAAEGYERLIESSPKNGSLRHRLAVVRVKQNRLDDAGAVFEDALQLKPHDAELLTDYGAYEYRRKNLDQAEKAFSKALAEKASATRARSYLTRVYAERGKDTELVKLWSHRDPIEGSIFVAQHLHQGGHTDKALALLTTARSRTASPQAQQQLSAVISQLGAKKSDVLVAGNAQFPGNSESNVKTADLPSSGQEVPPFEDGLGKAASMPKTNSPNKAPAFPDALTEQPKTSTSQPTTDVDPAFSKQETPAPKKTAVVQPEPTGGAMPFPGERVVVEKKPTPPPTEKKTESPPFENPVAKAKPKDDPFAEEFPGEPSLKRDAQPFPGGGHVLADKKPTPKPAEHPLNKQPHTGTKKHVLAEKLPKPDKIGWQPDAAAPKAADSGFENYCPVCLFDDAEMTSGKASYRSVYAGRAYYFASSKAKTTFENNPQKYLPVNNGADVVLKKNAEVDLQGKLTHARWYKSKLYFFRTKSTLKSFLADPEKYVVK